MDRDPLMLRMTEANLAAYGLSTRFVCGDALTAELPPVDAVFADPGRRPGGRRTLSVHDSEPPVPAVVARFPNGSPMAVKVAPGVPRHELAAFDADPEFISLDGELKECVLWFGPLRLGRVQATVLPGPHVLAGSTDVVADVGPIGGYLYDPDPAVSRSGLVGTLAGQLGALGVDHGVAFLTADAFTRSPFASAYRVEEVIPFSPKRVGEWLRQCGVGRVTVVKRAVGPGRRRAGQEMEAPRRRPPARDPDPGRGSAGRRHRGADRAVKPVYFPSSFLRSGTTR